VEEEVEAGDSIDPINRDRNLVTVSETVRLYINDTKDIKTMTRAAKVDALPDGWKSIFLSK
jgi:MOSC domain-containing protein YiiM